jgi:hypothetical protein
VHDYAIDKELRYLSCQHIITVFHKDGLAFSVIHPKLAIYQSQGPFVFIWPSKSRMLDVAVRALVRAFPAQVTVRMTYPGIHIPDTWL